MKVKKKISKKKNIREFKVAKSFIEDKLFPSMKRHRILSLSLNKKRDIKILKALRDNCLNILSLISPCIVLSAKRVEIALLEMLKDKLINLRIPNKQKINKKKFDEVRELIEICYFNIEILMTKNKLLFSDSDED